MKFNIGDKVWYASWGRKEIVTPCPVCFGKCVVRLILGDDSIIETPCSYCGLGYEEPRGYDTEYKFVAEAKPFTVTRVKVEVTPNGETREYYSDNYFYEENKCFTTENEALELSKTFEDEYMDEQKTRAEYIKGDKQKSFAWNVGYHLREAKRHREQIIYHEENAKLCKARVPEKTEGKK